MKKIWIYSTMLIVLFLLTSSCEETKDVAPDTSNLITGTVTIDTRSWSKWTYFSFEKESEVEINDFSTSSEWDIGFHSIDVRVNCGSAGPGQGGTYNAGKVDFSSIIEAPEPAEFVVNDFIDIIEVFAFPPTFVNVPGDAVLASWVTFSGPPPTYNLSDNVYIIKTASGKYAKIWLKSYFDDNAEAGFLKMQYVYQADGSRKLK